MKTLYETDFYAWLEDQIQLMKKKDFEHLDLERLLEEMEDLGSYYKADIEGHLIVLLMHMLKQKIQPENDSIVNARVQIRHKIEKPSLKNYPEKMLKLCYQIARRSAAKETKLEERRFPRECPWTIQEVMGE